MKASWLVGVCVVLLAMASSAWADPKDYFRITVADEQTGRGVPLVELETVSGTVFITDSNGIIAFNEPGMMGQEVYFHVRSHGYEYPADGFGFRGLRLKPAPGGSAEIKIKRINIAERLYRITGEGIYRDSVLVGEKTPLAHPLLNGQVLGQDSIQDVVYRGRIYWFWGDTNRLSYPLGQFAMSGATSHLPSDGGLDPERGIDLNYFVDEQGFSKRMCPTKEQGLMWLEAMVVVPDEKGALRLACAYNRMKDLGTKLEHGITIFNDEKDIFEVYRKFDLADRWRCPQGHPFALEDAGVRYFYFNAPLPNMRVRAMLKDVASPESYEAFTCLAPGTKYDRKAAKIDRAADGKLIYAWKRSTDPIGQRQERELIAAGKIKPEEARFQVRDIDSGKAVEIHGGSVYFNEHLKRWIMIAVQAGGTSFLGEVWLAEAPQPTGPWTLAHKIVTHNKYTFYNPAQHPFFDKDGGRIVYFEGTYCNTFSGNNLRTPRYDYNQIMYRLDLDDPRLTKLHADCAPGK